MTRNTLIKHIEGLVMLMIAILVIIFCIDHLKSFWLNEQSNSEGKVIGLTTLMILISSVIYLTYLSVHCLKNIVLLENHCYNNQAGKIDLKKISDENTFLGNIIGIVYKKYTNVESFDYKNLLNLEYNRNATKRAYVNYSIGIMVTLGILGTFVGLIDAVQKSSLILGTIGDLQSSEELARKFKSPFAGMNTAFSTSILGITGAIVLGFCNVYVTRLNNSLFIDLERYFQTDLIPALYPVNKSMQQLMINELKLINSSHLAMHGTIKTELDRFVKASENQQNSLVLFTIDIKKEIQDLSKSFNNNLNERHSQYVKELDSKHILYFEKIEKLAATIDKSTKKNADAIVHYTNEANNNLHSIRKNFEEALKNIQVKFSNEVLSLDSAYKANMHKLNEQFKKDLNSFFENLKQKNEETSNHIKGVTLKLIATSDEKIKDIHRISSENATTLHNIYESRLEKHVEELNAIFTKRGLEFSNTLQQNLSLFKSFQEEVTKQLKSLSNSIQNESQKIIKDHKAAASEYSQKTKILQETYGKYIELFGQLNGSMNDTHVQFSKLADNYKLHSESVGHYHEMINQLTLNYNKNVALADRSTQDLILSLNEMGKFFESLRKEEALISATFNQLLQVVFKNLDEQNNNSIN